MGKKIPNYLKDLVTAPNNQLSITGFKNLPTIYPNFS